MSIIQGAVSLTRYGVLDSPPTLTDDFMADRLQKNAFQDIETSPEEESMGWVEVLNHLSTSFEPYNFNFGDVLAMAMRVDTRRVPAKMVKRYFQIAEARARRDSDKPLSADQKRDLKAKIRMDLLSRTPVSTDLYEVCWFPETREVWLAATGSKVREKFEELWRRTFGFGLVMKIPFVLARELMPEQVAPESLDTAAPSALYGGGKYGSD